MTGLLAGALPLAGSAQTTETTPLPRYYVGLGIYQFPASGTYAPVVPTFGLQFRPRWAVQASVAFKPQGYDYNDSYAFYDYSSAGPNSGQYHDVNYSSTVRIRSLAVPVLVRYTLTRQQQHRFQADLLGGLTWLHRSYHSEQRTIDQTLGTDETDSYSYTNNNLYLTLGPSLRCRIWKGLEATGELTYQFKVFSPSGFYGSNFTGNVAAGLRYRFGN
ncbi:hypothetical protein BEN49_11405 [Hymenobacter coccineus]|uniref:Outer membrane protein beta-barrel domain-containing protein n=1 Tax=Hymenobacter coccineus TaxID=1908235 RepID=A0A1G1T067_9BACT|nr:hypothetical protein BEN49_11405 [Hymenobacter coccineus]